MEFADDVCKVKYGMQSSNEVGMKNVYQDAYQYEKQLAKHRLRDDTTTML